MPDARQPDLMPTPTTAPRPAERRGHARRCALRLALAAAVLVAAIVGAPPALAQMPGMAAETRREQAVSETAEVTPRSAADRLEEEATGLLRYWQRYMGEDSPYRGLILVIITLVILLNLKAYLTRAMRRTLAAKAFTQENTEAFLKMWNLLWKVATAILVIMAMSGSLRLLGLTAGFFGMMLGWSLQQPVTGIAAWLMIVLKKPFKIGDRVIIAGITGDVTGISLTHVILNQVGGSIAGEEKSGRGILIPNAILFQHVIINYTLEQETMLDEVPVRLTFDTDWDRAKALMIEAAREVTADIIAKTGQEPFIRAEFLDWGILARLRYHTIPARRQELSTYIVERLLKAFKDEYPRVRFATPTQSIRYRADVGAAPLAPEKTAAP
ncbi:MAG: mechanosensitive ion channel family protein [Lentisphaerae bacterium]|nr:mechanosensitive ion channel family protein [Lentisphaerota bacterium]